MNADLFIRDCRVVRPDSIVHCGLAVRDGVVAAVLRPEETVAARRTLDADGRFAGLLLPARGVEVLRMQDQPQP